MTIAGVVLILVAAYLFAKPHIDNYLHDKDKDEKIEQYDKNVKEQASKDKKQQAKPQIPKDKSKVAGYIEIPDADIKEPVYPGPATPEQLKKIWFRFKPSSRKLQRSSSMVILSIPCCN